MYAPAERADTLPLFLLYLYVLCVTHSGHQFGLIRERQLGHIFLKDLQYSFGVQDLQVTAAAVGCRLSLPQLQVQGPGPHQLGQARHVHRLQHHCPGAQGIECIL